MNIEKHFAKRSYACAVFVSNTKLKTSYILNLSVNSTTIYFIKKISTTSLK